MMRSRTTLLACFILFLAWPGQGQVKIGLSQEFPYYVEWLRQADSGVSAVDLYGLGVEGALLELASCDGLLLTGGEDVYPGYYGKLDQIARCEEINRYRDSLEFALIRKALELKIPVFGICRGEQILNVALGGSLLTDIPTDAGTAVLHRCPPGSENCLHKVRIDRHSRLHKITSIRKGIVNSYHHQAVDRIAPGMRVTARSENGIAEAIERADPQEIPFVMGVQWHPERLVQNPGLSRTLSRYFLEQVKK